jgi:hypothetical protein
MWISAAAQWPDGVVVARETSSKVTTAGPSPSPAELQAIAGLRNLKSPYLAETKVTAQGVTRLQKDLPSVQIAIGVELKTLAQKEPPALRKHRMPRSPLNPRSSRHRQPHQFRKRCSGSIHEPARVSQARTSFAT